MFPKTVRIVLLICMVAGVLIGCGEENAPADTAASTAFTTGVTTETTMETTSEATTEAATEATTEVTAEAATEMTTEATTEAATEVTSESTNAPIESTTAPTNGFSLDWKSVNLSAVGDTFTLYAGPEELSRITWSSDDESIATFHGGIVTAVAAGTTTVHAELDGVRSSCTVHCRIDDPVSPDETAPTTPADPRVPVLAPPSYQTVDSSFFSDAVFVGDSISEGLSLYCMGNGGLGDAKFLTRVSFGVYNELYGNFHVSYNGYPTYIADAISYTGAKKVFIMLGINDIGSSGVTKTIQYWPTLIQRIRDKNPDVQIYIQSILPVYTGSEYQGVNNANVNSYNSQLQEVAAANGCRYIDICQYMLDYTGGLARPYTSDRYVHLTNEGIRTWIQVLYAYAGA